MVATRNQRHGLPILQASGWSMLYGALVTGAAARLLGEDLRFDSSWRYVASWAYLAVFGSVLAFGAYLTLMQRIGAHRAGYAMVAIPVVALLISTWFEDLHWTREPVGRRGAVPDRQRAGAGARRERLEIRGQRQHEAAAVLAQHGAGIVDHHGARVADVVGVEAHQRRMAEQREFVAHRERQHRVGGQLLRAARGRRAREDVNCQPQAQAQGFSRGGA